MIWRFFDRRDITFKKNPRTRASRTARTSLSRRRWFEGQLDLDPLKLVFVDETAATTNMARRYGRRRRGQRLRCGVPHGHYKAITFVFGLRLRGVVAPKAYDHAMNAETSPIPIPRSKSHNHCAEELAVYFGCPKSKNLARLHHALIMRWRPRAAKRIGRRRNRGWQICAARPRAARNVREPRL